jgi:hypothetical protein
MINRFFSSSENAQHEGHSSKVTVAIETPEQARDRHNFRRECASMALIGAGFPKSL